MEIIKTKVGYKVKYSSAHELVAMAIIDTLKNHPKFGKDISSALKVRKQ